VKAIIIGAGIGGLTAAVAFQKAGIEAHVYERSPELREVGAGISIWANAVNALDALGLGNDVRTRSVPGGVARIRTSGGSTLSAASYDELTRRFGAALILMHRADLLAVLAGETNPQRVHLGFECTKITQDNGGVRAEFANGETAEGDVLIGADGLHSVVRTQLFGDSAPRYSGYTAWRAVAVLSHPNIVGGESWGCGQRFGVVPLSDGRVYWYATHNAPAGGHDPKDGAKEALLKLFQGWHEPIEALIEASGTILRNDIYDRDPLPAWSKGRATLLGDAAHPMSPNLGQGGCQAIEDGVELAVSLAKSKSVEAGLDEYQRRRIARTSKVVLRSRKIGEMAQWGNPVMCWLRNTLIRATPQSVVQRQVDWVVGYDGISADEKKLLGRS